jgi:hypothetical protein
LILILILDSSEITCGWVQALWAMPNWETPGSVSLFLTIQNKDETSRNPSTFGLPELFRLKSPKRFLALFNLQTQRHGIAWEARRGTEWSGHRSAPA